MLGQHCLILGDFSVYLDDTFVAPTVGGGLKGRADLDLAHGCPQYRRHAPGAEGRGIAGGIPPGHIAEPRAPKPAPRHQERQAFQ